MNTRQTEMLLCHGSRDSEISTGADYDGIAWTDLRKRAETPEAVEKHEAPAIIPSTYRRFDGRNFDRQREAGSFVALCGDIDTGNHALEEVLAALKRVLGEQLDLIAYSTASASAESRKWRFLVRLEQPLPGEEYTDAQRSLFELLSAEGIGCDMALERTAQLLFLPNVPPDRRGADDRPLFYEFRIEENQDRGLVLSETRIPARTRERQQEDEQRIVVAKREAEARQAKRGVTSASENDRLIDRFNENHPIKETLLRCGYTADRKGNWRSPYQAEGSGNFSTKLFGHRFVSLSGSDGAAGLGQSSASGARWGDAWDLYTHFEHGGDHTRAFRTYGAEVRRLEGPPLLGTPSIDDQTRREAQRTENREIGDQQPVSTLPELLDLPTAISRFLFASNGSRVIDINNPRRDYSLNDFRNTFCASQTSGEGKAQGKLVPVTEAWLRHPGRHYVYSKTFRPGAPSITYDPTGQECANTWRPFKRRKPSPDYERHRTLFENHVAMLFGADASRFCDWLAHIEQHPGVLPHTAWLHVSPKTGTGRNALASILTRVWRGHVAASFDLSRCLSSGFNGELAGKLLAIVDEIQEGGRSDEWAHAETLKRLITEEQRLVNPKYGAQHVEFNCARLLLFSNHVAAIPVDESDRRIEVAIFDGEPQSESYYRELYRAVNDPAFIADVAHALAHRDISEFNPGRHAERSVAKQRVQEVSQSEPALYAELLARHWPVDVIPNSVLAQVIDPDGSGDVTAKVRKFASKVGMRPRAKPISYDGKPTRFHIIRNYDQWASADARAVAKCVDPILFQRPDSFGWRGFVDELAAQATGTPEPFG